MFQITQRDETQEEYEQRKKELESKQLQDKKQTKKAGKKDEVVDEGPKRINDVKLTNVDLSLNYSADARWLASQLQFIKDRQIKDALTSKPIWSRVYPQNEGTAKQKGRARARWLSGSPQQLPNVGQSVPEE